MIDATVVVPTHDHADLLPFALRSALEQEQVSVEVFVIGDGVGQDTHARLEPFLADQRVRFFDHPKGPRLGEHYRHAALAEARGEIVTYLSDDDILLPGHVAEMRQLLGDADFAHPAPAWVRPDRSLLLLPFDVAQPEFRAMILTHENAIGLTGASHTLAAYHRLPHGWRSSPEGHRSDWYMWRQMLAEPWLRAVTGERLTCLHFPSLERRSLDGSARLVELEGWWERSRQPEFSDDLERLLGQAARRAGEETRLAYLRQQAHLRGVKADVAAMRATRTWRLRTRLTALSPLRSLLARRP